MADRFANVTTELSLLYEAQEVHKDRFHTPLLIFSDPSVQVQSVTVSREGSKSATSQRRA